MVQVAAEHIEVGKPGMEKLPNPLLTPENLQVAVGQARAVLAEVAAKGVTRSPEEMPDTLKKELQATSISEQNQQIIRGEIVEEQGEIIAGNALAGEFDDLCSNLGADGLTPLPRDKAVDPGGKGGLINDGTADQPRWKGRFAFIRRKASQLLGQPPDVMERDINHAYPTYIKALRHAAAMGDKEAAGIYDTLKKSHAVKVTSIDKQNGTQHAPVSLEEFDKTVDTQAEVLWQKEHPDMTWADAQAKFPGITHTYRTRAEKDIDPKAKYTFRQKTEAASSVPDAEAAKNKELETEKEAVAMTDDALVEYAMTVGGEDIRGKDGRIDRKKLEALKDKPAFGQVYGELSVLRMAYFDADPANHAQEIAQNPQRLEELTEARHNLAAIMYLGLRSVDSKDLPPAVDQRMKNFSHQEGPIIRRIVRIKKELDEKWLAPSGYRPETSTVDPRFLWRDLIMGLACEGQLQVVDGKYELPKEAGAVVSNEWKVGNDERSLIIGIAHMGHGRDFMRNTFNIDVDKLKKMSPAECANKVVAGINKSRQDRGQEPMKPVETHNVEIMSTHFIKENIVDEHKGSRIAGFMKGLAVFGVLMFPFGAQILGFTGASPREQAEE